MNRIFKSDEICGASGTKPQRPSQRPPAPQLPASGTGRNTVAPLLLHAFRVGVQAGDAIGCKIERSKIVRILSCSVSSSYVVQAARQSQKLLPGKAVVKEGSGT